VPGLYILVATAVAVDLLIVKSRYTLPGLLIVLLGIPVYLVRKRAARPAPGAGG
jgi:APA family basic amino acid/polyamine antiporter